MGLFKFITLCILISGVNMIPDRLIQDAGISIELSGQVFLSSEVISIPAVLSMGWVRSMFNDSTLNTLDKDCKERLDNIHQIINTQLASSLRVNLGNLLSKNELTNYQKILCHKEPELCLFRGTSVESSSTNRQKRFIFTTGAALGAGLGAFGYWLYDKIAGSSATHAIELLKTSQQQILRSVQTQGTTLLSLSHTTHQIWSLVVKTHEELSQLKNQMQCNDETLETLMRYIPLISMIPNQFHRSINDLLAGKVTPDLISYNQLKYLLKRTRSLENTLYHHDGSLFYQFSKTLPVEVNLESDLVTFIIQVPKITLESTGILYTVHNFGLHRFNEVRRIRLPHNIARFKMSDETHIHLAVVKSKCENTPGIWLCGQYSMDYSYGQQCLDSIMRGNITQCNWEGKIDSSDPEVLVTKSFVFIHTCTHTTTLFNITMGGKKVTTLNPICNTTRWFHLTTFDILIVGAHHIDGQRNKVPTLMELNEDMQTLVNKTYSLHPYGSTWKSELEIKDTIESQLNISRSYLLSEFPILEANSLIPDYLPLIPMSLMIIGTIAMYMIMNRRFKKLEKQLLDTYAQQLIHLNTRCREVSC